MNQRVRVAVEEAPAEVIASSVEEFRGVRRVINARLTQQEGTPHPIELRPVVATLEECLSGKGDWFNPLLKTWIRSYGKSIKLERDPNITPAARAVESGG